MIVLFLPLGLRLEFDKGHPCSVCRFCKVVEHLESERECITCVIKENSIWILVKSIHEQRDLQSKDLL